MGQIRLHSPILGWCCFLCVASFLVPSAGHGDKDEPKAFPKGSEKAVAAIRTAFPKAEIIEKNGKERTLKVKPGGEMVKKFEFPRKK